jgi:hypothetical protein
MSKEKNLISLDHFQLLDEHEDDVFKVFSELNISEQLPELFLQLSPFKPNKPGPKAKYIEEIIMQNTFGSVVLNGTELTVFDEDVLLAIISTKKQIVGGDYYFITSLREVATLIGATWRGAKFDNEGNLIGNSTPKQILQSIHRLWSAGLTINVYKQKQAHNIRLVTYYANPLLDENNKKHYTPGVKDQIKVKISKEFLYFYHIFKKFTIKLEDRIKINHILGKAIYRYLTYLTTFKYNGIHEERLSLLITKINWDLPRKNKESEYIDWREVKRQLDGAAKGLLLVGIILEYPIKLNEESKIAFKNKKFHQATIELD